MKSSERLDRMVTSILDAIEAGEDHAPLVARLEKAQPWLIAEMGMEATQDSINRTLEADGKLNPDGPN